MNHNSFKRIIGMGLLLSILILIVANICLFIPSVGSLFLSSSVILSLIPTIFILSFFYLLIFGLLDFNKNYFSVLPFLSSILFLIASVCYIFFTSNQNLGLNGIGTLVATCTINLFVLLICVIIINVLPNKPKP